MKSLLTITTLILFFNVNVLGQNGYSISPQSFEESYNEDLSNVGYFRFEALMGNSSDSTLIINWEIVNIDLPLEWGLSVSDKDMSYAPGPPFTTNNGYPLVFYSGESNIPFNIDVYPNQTSGCGTFDVLISLDNSEFNLDTIEYEISVNDDSCLISSTNNQDNYKKIKVFPNPFMDYLEIQSEIEIKHITIYNLAGVPVTSQLSNFQNLELSSLEAGMYFLEIVFDNDDKLTKQIIQGN